MAKFDISLDIFTVLITDDNICLSLKGKKTDKFTKLSLMGVPTTDVH